MQMKKNMDNFFQIDSFLKRFFTANQCDITEEQNGKMSVQLTVKMDKALMNRPFYWQYVETTGKVGEPKKLHFITDPEKIDDEGEWIHFGSPRLQQIFFHLSKTAKFTQLYQSLQVTSNTMLHPWLLVNICIMYEGKQKKEELFSIGLNLINGSFVFGMMEKLTKITLKSTISDRCYTISPLIKLSSGFLRIEKYLDNYITEQTHDWALESLKLLEEEKAMIHHFYESDASRDEMEKEIAEVTARLQPKITYEVMSGGLIYLTETFMKDIA